MKIETPNNGYAEIIQYSKNEEGKEIITYSLKYGLIVHAEMLRHRLLTNNVKSNRAVSMKQIRNEVLKDPYVPVKFGKQQKGMVASSEADFKNAGVCRWLWKSARYPAVFIHWTLEKLGLHKEITNRVLNPWQWVRETLTATEFDNFYHLRLHKDAQTDIQVIAKAMLEAKNEYPESDIVILKEGEYHVPYVKRSRNTPDGKLVYLDNDMSILTPQEAIEASCARCARSSYDNHDGTKALYHKTHNGKGRSDKEIYQDLVNSNPVHGSCAEHQATPMKIPYNEHWFTDGSIGWKDGVTHVDKNGYYWSGNFKGFVQYRQTLKNHVCWEYTKENS